MGFQEQARTGVRAPKQIIDDNEPLDQEGRPSARAFEQAQRNQSSYTRQIASAMKPV